MRLCGAAWRGAALRKGGRSKVNLKVNYHHHVRQVDHFLHVPHVGHLHMLTGIVFYLSYITVG